MSNENDSIPKSGTTYDSQLTDLYADRPVTNQHLIGINSTVRNTDVVKSTDYDEEVARAAAQRAAPSSPSAPAVAPASTPLNLSSARTSTGQRVSDPSQVTGDTIVTFEASPGEFVEATIETLMSIGAVTRDANGQYIAAAPQAAQEPEQTEQQQTEATKAPLDEHSEALLRDAFAKAPAQTVGAATSFIQNEGAITDEAVAQFATSMGIEPEAARAKFNHVSAAFTREAVQLGAKAVQCSEEIAMEALTHARTNRAAELKETAQRHFSEGRADYSKFVSSYLENLDQTDPNKILTATPVAGRKVHWDRGNKVVVVTLPNGTELSWSAAVKAKLISM